MGVGCVKPYACIVVASTLEILPHQSLPLRHRVVVVDELSLSPSSWSSRMLLSSLSLSSRTLHRGYWLGFVIVGLKPACSCGCWLEENVQAKAKADCKLSCVTSSAWLVTGLAKASSLSRSNTSSHLFVKKQLIPPSSSEPPKSLSDYSLSSIPTFPSSLELSHCILSQILAFLNQYQTCTTVCGCTE